MTYGVVICTRCRGHAQIIETGSSKTTRCQRCNATLMTRKLRVFFSSEDLEEAISVRTQIQAKIADDNPEKLRPETRKTDLSVPINIINTVNDETKIKILNNNLDSGSFLHDASWNGIKTLGLVKPIHPEFKIFENKILVKYKCNEDGCKGHTHEVPHHTMEEYDLQNKILTDKNALEDSLVELNRQVLLKKKELWFVMGTILTHPKKWILIEIIITLSEKDGD